MRDWKASGGIKIERAKQHVADLEERARSFLQTAPYTLISENDPKTRDTVYRWSRVQPGRDIPPIWGAIAGDAIHNLRSALDVLWRRATKASPGDRDRRRGAYFPFPKGADELETRLARVREPRVRAALQIVSEFKPYQSGNENLWLLHEASVADKHEVPAVVVCAFRDATFTVTPTSEWTSVDFSVTQHVWAKGVVLLEDGAEFVRVLPGQRLDLDEKYQPTFGVAFGEGGPLYKKSVLFTLHEFARITNAITEAFLRDRLVA